MIQHKFDHSIVIDSVPCLQYRYIEDKMFQAFLGIDMGLAYTFGMKGLNANSSEYFTPILFIHSDLHQELVNICRVNLL